MSSYPNCANACFYLSSKRGRTFITIFPVLQLGAMENGSPIQIISPTIMRGLRAVRSQWIGFMLMASAMAVGVALTWQLRQFENAVGNFVASLAAIGAVIHFYRALGRTIWLAQEALAGRQDGESEPSEASSK